MRSLRVAANERANEVMAYESATCRSVDLGSGRGKCKLKAFSTAQTSERRGRVLEAKLLRYRYVLFVVTRTRA